MQPLYKHGDRFIDQEFKKLYQYVDKLSDNYGVGTIVHILTDVPYDSANNENIIGKTDYLLTNGQQVPIVEYPALYEVLGTSFNTASTLVGNFNVPTIPKSSTYTGFAIRGK